MLLGAVGASVENEDAVGSYGMLAERERNLGTAADAAVVGADGG